MWFLYLLDYNLIMRGGGFDVVRFNLLYREKGAGVPERMPKLQACFSAVVEHARTEVPGKRLIIGGRSMGGRAAPSGRSKERTVGPDCLTTRSNRRNLPSRSPFFSRFLRTSRPVASIIPTVTTSVARRSPCASHEAAIFRSP